MSSESKFYYVDTFSYQPSKPSAHENLTEKFELQDLAYKVRRVDEQGNKRKMRRSYKAYIQDLPGSIEIAKDNTIRQWYAEPRNGPVEVDLHQLHASFRLEPGLIPGFNSKIFGLDEDVTETMSRDSSMPRSPARRRKRV
ncbi:mediator complex subunit Med19/Rox3 [Schizosaccharomyces japonicus yFS275]|uniref:Mediator of RNA polymerase II transcription subunit 19 n=1 Tax=Schizosaccharomyces japonicus (strain yFS275 / FY16936) TaxID=402676 RepID=B6K2M7_SCHJY|nr:mediator complex subunit Med19/Rox3 [Schizosaccharomyces japonicus yFS275]EEB07408.1 mediator complex subunit Med19/Rox3 [Schizosaccharomyces japonicus yFS275]